MSKLPATQWYWADWMKDPAVRSVSYAARGLWMDMLSMMHENGRRGYLQVNGKPATLSQLARMTGGETGEVSRLLQELESADVFSRSDDGCIYNRRMVRDERKRSLCSDAGKKGGGNPTLKGQLKGEPKGDAKGSLEDEDADEVLAKELPKISLAQKIAGEMCLQGPGVIQEIAGAIDFCMKHEGRSPNAAVQFLIAEGKREIASGGAPDRFWFSGRKWRQHAKGNGKSNLQEELDVIDNYRFGDEVSVSSDENPLPEPKIRKRDS